MSYQQALFVMVAIAIVALALMAWGWKRRSRRDAGFHAPLTPLVGDVRAQATGLYVATTPHDVPLERLAVKHLAFRSRVAVTVLDDGVRLELPGSPVISIPASSLVAIDRATVTIDRVVERDGLVRLAWKIDAETVVDSYLRLQQTDPTLLISAISTLISVPASTGTDA